MTSGDERRPSGRRRSRGLWRRSPKHELTMTLLLGAAGAGLIFLATRQGWAQVRTVPPRPLPASLVTVTGAALIPFADALVLAGLATLAAVLATRKLLRRITGLLLAGIGAGLAASAFALSAGDAVAAANSTTGPATATAGSVMNGAGPGSSAAPNVAGTASHVTFIAAGWQVLVLAGALAMIGAGILVVLRAERMAVMSSRYDAPAGSRQAASESRPHAVGARDAASMWEALSCGDDPTSAGSRSAGT